MTLAPTGTVDRLGNVTIHGTITCSEQATFADLSAFLRQAVGRFSFTGNAIGHGRLWADALLLDAQASSQNGKFGGGKISVEIRAFACSQTSCADSGTAGTVRLGR